MHDLTPTLALLMNFFILSLVLESAYTTLFSWRIYMVYLGGKGFKVPIMVVSNILLLVMFDYDFFEELFKILSGGSYVQPPESGGLPFTIGHFFSSLLLAGGSKAVLEILNTLKIRNIAETDRKQHILKLERVNELSESKQIIPHLIFDKTTGSLAGLGGKWQATSGTTSGIPEIVDGIYTCPPRSLMIGTEDDDVVPRDKKYADAPFLDINNFGWFMWLGKGNLGIHPDGNVPGTEGCIGIKDSDTRELFEALKNTYMDKVIVQVK